MLHQDRVNALRQTHSTVATIMPLVTAGLTVTGALLAAFEARSAAARAEAHSEAHSEAFAQPEGVVTPHPASVSRPTRRSGSIRRYVAALAGRLLMVLLGMGLVLAIVYAATATGRIGQAVVITALILFTLYLVEKVARQA